MPIDTAKKSEQVAVKMTPEQLRIVDEIAQREDRHRGYVVRELMLRGIMLYQSDGLVREEPQIAKGAAPVLATITPSAETMSKREIANTINGVEGGVFKIGSERKKKVG